MAVDSSEVQKANGLTTLVDTIISPKEAFERLAISPTWGWALIVSVVLPMAAYYFMIPAVEHGMLGDFAKQAATNPAIAQMSPERRAKFAGYAPYFVIITPIAILFFVLLQTVVMTIFNAIGKGQGTFGKLWAAAMNICVLYGIGQIVAAIVVVLRGPDSFNSGAEVQRALPSLALLAPPGGDPHLLAFLATINPIVIWSVVLVALAMRYTAKVAAGPAWGAAIVSYALPMLLGVAFAR
ncbi:MAG TPA: YIP1 family protein [Candidatus Baltobacteraceae bacterium]|nr:YIP1 family protein [Candidatus Baltobacteraceae bacterium]